MKQRKPDRFDQISVDNVEWHTPAGTPTISSYEVAKLLRNEHAWMKRMVRSCLKGATDTGYVIACSNILGQLAQRRK